MDDLERRLRRGLDQPWPRAPSSLRVRIDAVPLGDVVRSPWRTNVPGSAAGLGFLAVIIGLAVVTVFMIVGGPSRLAQEATPHASLPPSDPRPAPSPSQLPS